MFSASSERRFTPNDLADNLKRSKGIGAVSLKAAPKESSDTPKDGPYEGKIVEIDGQKYRYAKVPTGQQEWNGETRRFEPTYFTLRDYFSHSTPAKGIGLGPGWDGRFALLRLTAEEQQARYGHVFTRQEVSSPAGDREYVEDDDGYYVMRNVGGMPDDIFYFGLEPLDLQGSELE